MKLSQLIAIRNTINLRANLANQAYAFLTLQRFAARIANAQLRGSVRMRPAAAEEHRYWATLTALQGSQAVIEEHFNEDDVEELADAITLARDGEADDCVFRLEDLERKFVVPLGLDLCKAGVDFDLKDTDSPPGT